MLDLRYNGGGYLDIASELAYMIAGPAQTAGKTFELLQFNAKHPVTDPVPGSRITPLPFHEHDAGLPGAARARRCRTWTDARVCADQRGNLFGQRVHHQWTAAARA